MKKFKKFIPLFIVIIILVTISIVLLVNYEKQFHNDKYYGWIDKEGLIDKERYIEIPGRCKKFPTTDPTLLCFESKKSVEEVQKFYDDYFGAMERYNSKQWYYVETAKILVTEYRVFEHTGKTRFEIIFTYDLSYLEEE